MRDYEKFLIDIGGVLEKKMSEHINGLRTELKEEIGGLRTELKEEIGGLRTELKEEIGSLRTELKEEIGSLRTEMNQKFEAVNQRLDHNDRSIALLEEDFQNIKGALELSAQINKEYSDYIKPKLEKLEENQILLNDRVKLLETNRKAI